MKSQAGFFRARLLLAPITVIAILAAACGSTRTNATSPPAEAQHTTTTVNVMWQPGNATGYYVALDKHLFNKVGIQVSSTEEQSAPPMLAALASGSAAFAQVGVPAAIVAITKGIPVKVFYVAAANPMNGLVTCPGSKITSVHDLSGAKIGYTQGTGPDIGMHIALKNVGIPLTSFTLVNMPPNELLPACSKNEIAAAWTWDTWVERIVQAGGKLIFRDNSHGVTEGSVWEVSSHYLSAHPKTVAKFTAVLNAGAVESNRNPNIALAEFATLVGLTKAATLQVEKEEPAATTKTLLSPQAPLSLVGTGPQSMITQLNGAFTVLKSEGLVSGPRPDFASLVESQSAKQSQQITVP